MELSGATLRGFTPSPAQGLPFHAHLFFEGSSRHWRRQIDVDGARALGTVGVISFSAVMNFMTYLMFFGAFEHPNNLKPSSRIRVQDSGADSLMSFQPSSTGYRLDRREHRHQQFDAVFQPPLQATSAAAGVWA